MEGLGGMFEHMMMLTVFQSPPKLHNKIPMKKYGNENIYTYSEKSLHCDEVFLGRINLKVYCQRVMETLFLIYVSPDG